MEEEWVCWAIGVCVFQYPGLEIRVQIERNENGKVTKRLHVAECMGNRLLGRAFKRCDWMKVGTDGGGLRGNAFDLVQGMNP